MTHQERARLAYHDWRERCLQAGKQVYISNVDLLEEAIAAALQQVETETAAKCAEIADAAAGPFPGVGTLRPCAEIAAKIRAAFPEVKQTGAPVPAVKEDK